MNQTPETQAVLDEIEKPIEISPDEMESARYSYDLPQNSDAKSAESETDAVNINTSDRDEISDAPEQDSQSEIPGDPRQPHETQPPTADQY